MEKKLTPEQQKKIDAAVEAATIKAASLATELNLIKVHPICFYIPETDEVITGFVGEPKRQAKFAAIDELMKSMTSAGEMLLRSSLLKEHSDPRLISDNPEHDDIFSSGVMECLKFVQAYQNEVKKN